MRLTLILFFLSITLVRGQNKSDQITIIIDNPQGLGFHLQWYSLDIEENNLYSKNALKDTFYISSEMPVWLLSMDQDKIFGYINNVFWPEAGDVIVLKKETEVYATHVYDSVRTHELGFFPALGNELGAIEGFGIVPTAGRQSAIERLHIIRDLYHKRMTFLENYEKPLSDEFKKNVTHKLYYESYLDFLSRYYNHKSTQMDISSFTDEIWTFIEGMKFDPDYLEVRKEGSVFFLKSYALFSKEHPDGDLPTFYGYAKNNYLNTTERDLILFSVINQSVVAGLPQVSALIDDFIQEAETEHLKKLIKKKYGALAIGLSADSEARYSLLLNYNTGNQAKWADILEKYSGKLVYIDFWASWCGPCLAEMPASEKLKKAYEDREDMVFLYLSQDNNQDSWKKTIENRSFDWKDNYLLMAGNRTQLLKNFNITSIPRYILIGREGEVLNFDAPRPSDPKLREVLDKCLED